MRTARLPAAAGPAPAGPSRSRLPALVLAVLLALLPAGLSGCSDDTSKPESVEPSGYHIETWLGVPPSLTGGYETRIIRLGERDTSAARAQVTINGTALSLLSAESGPDTALFRSASGGYLPQTEYTVAVQFPDTSDTSRFTTPVLPGVHLTAPHDGEEFTPGLPLEIAWQYLSGTPDSVCLVFEFAKKTADLPTSWVTVAASPAAYPVPAEVTARWLAAEVYISVGPAVRVGAFQGPLASADSYVGARAYREQIWLLPGEPLPPSVFLADVIAASPPGDANGHTFAHLVSLDPDTTYAGGALIREDTCIHGNGARLELRGGCIHVAPSAFHYPRCDVDHCLIIGGGALSEPSWGGGGLFYERLTSGWIFNNTFYNNMPYDVYVNLLVDAGDASKIINNIFYTRSWGLVRNNQQPNLYIRHNDSFIAVIGVGTYGTHTGCTECTPEPMPAGELHSSNASEDPLFVENPSDKRPGNFHLRPNSPCIGTGEDPLTGEVSGNIDKGAFPFSASTAR